MDIDMSQLPRELAGVWDDYGHLVILGVGLLGLGLVITSLVLLFKAKNKAKWINTLTAAVVMLWTSEGLVQVALGEWHLPWAFVGIAFFVFEALMLSSAMEAEEHRRRKGVPGPAGRYVFLIAATSGFVASFGSDQFGLQFLRIALPVLAVGRWWISLSAERDDDSDEVKAERKKLREEREATWAITPTKLLIKWRLKTPGRTTTTEAQLKYQIERMVVLADKAATAKWDWRRRRLLRSLRKETRTATDDMIAEVARRVDRADRAEELMVPARRRTGNTPAEGVTNVSSAPFGAPDGARLDASAERAESDTTGAPDGTHARADNSAPLEPARASGVPEQDGARVEVAAARASRPRSSRVATRRLVPAPRSTLPVGARATGARAEVQARNDAAYAQYAGYIEKNGAEPDGETVAEWLSLAHAGSGRKARVPWRARMAEEITTGTRARPARLPGEVAALLPPEVRTRAPEDDVEAGAQVVDMSAERAPENGDDARADNGDAAVDEVATPVSGAPA